MDGLGWLLLTLVPLLFLQRILHREIQAVFLLLTRRHDVTTILFAGLFFPGVFLHELSHFLMAKLLGVRTGRFSLIPSMQPNGRLRLGYVETYRSDFLRDSFVGAAPLIFGMLAVAIVASTQLHLTVLWDTFRNGQWPLFILGLKTLPTLPNFWLWFYLTFVISSTMMPSESDRHAWTPVLLVGVALLSLALFVGMGPWMLENFGPPINEFLRVTALILLVSIIIHVVFIFPFLLFHRMLSRLTGLDVT